MFVIRAKNYHFNRSIGNEACRWANVKGKTPHPARHAMGRHIMSKTGNAAAVQWQLGLEERRLLPAVHAHYRRGIAGGGG
jgi:hypothetical protein